MDSPEASALEDVLRQLRGSEAPAPAGVRELVQLRLLRVGGATRQLLEVAALFGARMEEGLLRATALTQSLSPAAVDAALAEAEAQALLLRAEPGQRTFPHALIQEGVERGLSPQRRAELHLAAARVLEEQPLTELERALHRQLSQWLPLANAGDALVLWAVKLSARHVQQAAYEDAIAVLERALATVQPCGTVRWSAELWLALAQAHGAAENVSRARELALRVAEYARAQSDPTLLARAALAYATEPDIGVTDDVQVALLREARGRLSSDAVALQARLLAALAAALQPSLQPEEPVALAREAIAVARAADDEELLLAVLHSALGAMMDFVPAAQRLPLNLEQRRLARKLGDRLRELRAHLRLVLDGLELGDLTLFEGHAAAFEALARSLRQRSLEPIALRIHSTRAAMAGDFDRSLALTEQAEALYRRTDWGLRRWVGLHRLGVARIAERRLEQERQAEALLQEWGADSVWQLFFPPVQASLEARCERPEQAAFWLARCANTPVLLEDVSSSVMVGEAAALAGDLAFRRTQYQRLLPRAGSLVSWGLVGMVCDGPLDRTLALLAASLEDWDAAARFFDSAERQTRALGLRPYLARVLYDRARVWLAHGRAPAQAQANLAEARELAQALGLDELVERIERCAPPLAPRVPFELEKDGDLWRVRGQDQSFHLKDSRGLQLLSKLVSAPGQDLHVFDLIADRPGTEATADAGDAGPLLDPRARKEYRDRLETLAAARDEAEASGDLVRARRAQEERDFLVQELSRAFGVGDKARRAGSAAERARVSVTVRLRKAIQIISGHAPRLGQHLDRSVRTGLYCSYRPEE